MRQAQWWRWWLAGGALAIVGYFFLPAGSTAANVLYDVIGLISGLAILVAVRLHRAARPAMWYWFAAGQIMSVLGDFSYSFVQNVLHGSPYPSFADIFYLGSYPVTFTGLVLLIRRSRGRTVAGLLDAAIVATGLGLAFWIFVLHPIAAGSAVSALERFVDITYPTVDLLLLAGLARLFTDPGNRTPSTRMLGLATVLVFVADVSFSVITLYSDSDGHAADAGFLLSYVFWAAAALHPSMAAGDTSDRARPTARVRVARLVAFGTCSLVAPALLLLPRVSRNGEDRTVVTIGAIVLFLLVIGRMGGFMAQVQRQSGTLERMALQDELTGLANRWSLEQAAPDRIVLLGLNGFKNVNDELGRPVGDRVLRAVADRLRGSGALVARIGGDEFAIVPGADEDDVALAERIGPALRRPITVGAHELLVGIGIGLAGRDSDGSRVGDGSRVAPGSRVGDGSRVGPGEVLRQAEVAMHAAKQTGEPWKRWTPALDERSAADVRLGAELRAALDAGQFRVVYQPIVRLPEGRVHAVEALVRWEHPTRGVVSPIHFVPVAEQNGLIVELGAWILHTACARLVAWRAELGPDAPTKVSVNVSARQLARPGFAGTVAATLAATGLPAECLVVEVTETAVFEGGQAVTALHELRSLGVRVALDDFGTGHSSLGLLQTVPVDTLKVDKSFVDRITEAGRHAVIAQALIQVSNGLGLAAVAEGVETREQAAALYDLGYRLLQGYHYGRPVDDPDFDLVRATATAAHID
ncbi:MAG TPA: bifunctional diguanylate cyclase/phosphodiesterase [Actinoplanes sp.]